ncbi:MAG: hypothetical protein HYZ48_02100, partial [Chlamydiales bacterium]|nr:hypothetical protein [Chlamydiales bacterium]
MSIRLGCFLIAAFFTTLLQGEVRFLHRTNAFATHQPVLYEIGNRTDGPIIEFGCGDGSTDLLHAICKKNKRLLISIDDDEEWLKKFARKYLGDGYEEDNSGWHMFFFVPGVNRNDPENCDHWIAFLDNNPLLKALHFDLCFVDQAPWMARLETIKRFRSKSKYIILHDCDYFPEKEIVGTTIVHTDYKNGIQGIYLFDDILRYSRVYYPLKPWPLFSGPPTLLG